MDTLQAKRPSFTPLLFYSCPYCWLTVIPFALQTAVILLRSRCVTHIPTFTEICRQFNDHFAAL